MNDYVHAIPRSIFAYAAKLLSLSDCNACVRIFRKEKHDEKSHTHTTIFVYIYNINAA